jgi:hypothetical protein
MNLCLWSTITTCARISTPTLVCVFCWHTTRRTICVFMCMHTCAYQMDGVDRHKHVCLYVCAHVLIHGWRWQHKYVCLYVCAHVLSLDGVDMHKHVKKPFYDALFQESYVWVVCMCKSRTCEWCTCVLHILVLSLFNCINLCFHAYCTFVYIYVRVWVQVY